MIDLAYKSKMILKLDKTSKKLSTIEEISLFNEFRIHTIYNSADLPAKAKIIQPDLIFMDFPHMDNDCELICRVLKKEEALKDIPVVILTTSRSRSMSPISYKFDALFVKPPEMTLIAERIYFYGIMNYCSYLMTNMHKIK